MNILCGVQKKMTLQGELWYDKEKGGISHLLIIVQVITLTIWDIINKVNELNDLVKDNEYFKHQKELLDGNN